MIRRVSSLGFIWSVVVAAALTLYGVASWRAQEPLQTAVAVASWAAAFSCLSAPFVPAVQTGRGAAIRVGVSTSAFLLRSFALIIVGTARIDRTGELIGAGTSACFAAAVVLMRLQFEVTIAAAASASTD